MRHTPIIAAASCLGALALLAALAPAGAAEGKMAHASYTEAVPGTAAKFDMVAVPGGTFSMGSPEGEPGRSADEGPAHAVTVRPFWIGKCEVSWDEFDLYQTELGVESPDDNEARVKESADAITGPTPPYVDKDYGHGHEGHPALCMTHHSALEYCRWLSKKTGKLYRLPTEAEWEYACRAGSKAAYCFGDDADKLADYGWYRKNSPTEELTDGTTHKVGTKKPNAFGLHDMHGNVMEWCLDHYFKDTYAKFASGPAALSPVVVPTEKKWSHVVRGGSWADEAAQCRSAARRGSQKDWMKHDPQRPQSIWWLTKFDVIGFRVARAVEEQPELKGLRSKVTRQSD